MVPEIWSMADRIFCHFGLFSSLCTFLPYNPKNQNFEKMKKLPRDMIILHMCTINDNHMMYGSWDMEHNRQNFFSFWTVFWPFYPHNNPENQNFKKLKKTPGDIIILHMCAINDIWMYSIIGCMVPDILSTTDRFFCHFVPFFLLLPS